MIDQKDVTIIIPSLSRNEQQQFALNQCIASLSETVPEMDKIIAFNGIDSDRTIFKNYFPQKNTELMFLEAQGQCVAVNAAVATTNTKWIFVTNDDMIYAPGWWEILANTYYDIGCISPKLIEPRPGAPTFEVYFCGGAGGDFDKQKWLTFADEYMKADVHRPVRTGFNLPFLMRRDVWDTVGGYDINYDPWGSNSDSDLEYKIKLAGIQPHQNQNSIVYHFSQTSGTFEPKNHAYWEKNWSYFIEKWGFPRTDNGIWEANFFIPTIEQGRIFQPSWENKFK